MAGAVLFGICPSALAQPAPTPAPPAPPGCSAADLAQTSANVSNATAMYLFTHPDVNNFLTSMHGVPTDEVPAELKTYFDANPQARAELTAIRQPLTDLRNRCEMPAR